MGCARGVIAAFACGVSIAGAQAPEQPPPEQPPPESAAAEPPAEPPPEPPAPTPATPPLVTGDATLVRNFEIIFSEWSTPVQRSAAINDPSLLDRRAVAPLVFLLYDHDPEIRAAAARQLGRMPRDIDARAETALIGIAQMQEELAAVRIAAIEALGGIGGPASVEPLRDLYANYEHAEEIRNAAKAVLVARWPDELRKGLPALDRSGRQGLIGGSSVLGSYTLGAVGALGKNNAGIAIGTLGGAVVGSVTAAYLTRSGEITKAQAGWMVTAGMWGAMVGMGTAASIQRDPDHRVVLSLGLAGEVGVFTVAAMTRNDLRYSGDDVGEINGMGALAVHFAGGALLFARPDSDRTTFATLTLAGVAGLSAGLAIAPTLELNSNPDGALVAIAAIEGGALGGLAPAAWFYPVAHDQYYAGASMIGSGLGLLAGGVLGHFYDIPRLHLGYTFMLSSYGKLLGYSIPLLKNDSALPGDARGTFLGTVGGLAAGIALADKIELKDGDGALIGLGTALGGWHGLGLSIAADESKRESGGWFNFGTSAIGLGTLALAHHIDIENQHVQALAGGFFWGTWFSAWTAALRDTDARPALRATIVAGDAGLALSGVLVSPAVDIDARRIGIAYLGGLSGAALASLGAALVTRDNDKLIGANLAGSGIGLALGAMIASQWTFAPPAAAPTTPAPSSGISLSAPLLTPLVLQPPGGGMPGLGIAATFIEE